MFVNIFKYILEHIVVHLGYQLRPRTCWLHDPMARRVKNDTKVI
jgi:hypothetical protein